MSRPDRFDALFEHTADAVADVELVDGVPVVRAVNQPFVDTFGYDRETVVDEPLTEFVVPDRWPGWTGDFDSRFGDDGTVEVTVPRQTTSGIRTFRYRGVPYESGGVRRGLAVYTDVTDRERAEQHHRVLHRVLRHNLRNELVPIVHGAEALSMGGEPADHAPRIRAAARNLERLSDAATTVERVLGEADGDLSELDLAAVLEDAVAHFDDEYPAADLTLAAPESLTVVADGRLGLAFENLLENAVEHNDGTPSVRVDATRDSDGVVVAVADDGPGIPRHEREAIFGDQSITQLTHGSGLGLWLAKWVVESHGGRLGYDREDGRTVLTVRLPVLAAPVAQ